MPPSSKRMPEHILGSPRTAAAQLIAKLKAQGVMPASLEEQLAEAKETAAYLTLRLKEEEEVSWKLPSALY